MLAEHYMDAVEQALKEARKQLPTVLSTSKWVVEALAQGGVIWAFGSTHAAIACEELFYRAGGLILVNPLFAPGLTTTVRPITLTSELERMEGYGRSVVDQSHIRVGDVVIVVSVSGRNTVPIDVALAAKQKGARVIGVTSMAYANSVKSRHSSGLRLCDLELDAIFDLGGVAGDAAIPIPGTTIRSGPTSTAVAVYLLNALMVEVVGILTAAGWNPPPVFMSANMEGGDAHNRHLFKQYGERLAYL